MQSRFGELKHTVLDEANAIGTAYWRVGLLPETDRAAIRGLLNEYLDIRVEAMQADGAEH